MDFLLSPSCHRSLGGLWCFRNQGVATVLYVAWLNQMKAGNITDTSCRDVVDDS